MSFKDTSLHAVEKLGGMELVGAGSLGGTIWLSTLTADGEWKNTSLEDVTKLGGMELVGAGSLGGTIWTLVI